ncbi:MAG: hypothetical protein LBG64_03460 [Pseudomonadales bacterium]|jgi:peptidoglycan hydrolase-like amidase|nr:hypothetical protein [Pseudomonadales bacterium]
MRKLLIIVLATFLALSPVVVVHADPVQELQRQIDELTDLRRRSEEATVPLVQEVGNLQRQINSIRANINNINAEMDELEESIEEREENLGNTEEILRTRVIADYKSGRRFSPLRFILAPRDNSEEVAIMFFHQTLQRRNQAEIEEIVGDISQLTEDRITLEETRLRLTASQRTFNEQVAFFQGEIDGARAHQQQLAGQIAALSAQQQAIINERSGGGLTSGVGDVPHADDPFASIAFRDRAPANTFAVFSIGAYTHRNGMSQWGARARALAGQNFEEIIRAYYPNARLIRDYNRMDQILVDGHGWMSFEDNYLHGIHEIPINWPREVQKVQAIAARTYAVRRTAHGQRSICTTEACQVFRPGRRGGAWSEAVEYTRGWILVDDAGNPVQTQYAAVHGGWSNTSGWDTTDGQGGENWTNRAWEVQGNAPWFFKAWFRRGYASSGNSCGLEHPWLSQEQMSDILNARIVQQNPNGANTSRILPITINECAIGSMRGNPYSMSEMRANAERSGGAVTNISSVSTIQDNNTGNTTRVSFQTNRGEISMTGDEFKRIFNLRAPGHVRIPQSTFTHIQIEHRR